MVAQGYTGRSRRLVAQIIKTGGAKYAGRSGIGSNENAMIFVLSLVLSYLFIGFTRAANGLTAEPSQKPAWALNSRPTFATVLGVMATWPVARIQDAKQGSTDNSNRDVALALMNVAVDFALLAVLIWGAVELAVYISENPLFEILLSILFVFVVLRFLVPIINLLISPLMILLGFGLDFIFGRRRRQDRG